MIFILSGFRVYVGFPPTFQSGLSSSLPSYTGQQSSIYGDTNNSSSFTTPTTATVSSHSSSSAFHKPDESSSSSTSGSAGIPAAATPSASASASSSAVAGSSSSSTSSSYGLHHEPSNYNSSSLFSVPTLATQQQVCFNFLKQCCIFFSLNPTSINIFKKCPNQQIFYHLYSIQVKRKPHLHRHCNQAHKHIRHKQHRHHYHYIQRILHLIRYHQFHHQQHRYTTQLNHLL